MSDYKNVMLTSPDNVKAENQVNYNTSDATIAASIRTAQETYLREVIGDDLLDKLKLLVYGDLTGEGEALSDDDNKDYAELLDDYIEPFLVAKTVVEIVYPISFEIRNIGVIEKYDTNITSTNLQNLASIRNYYETLACDRANRLIEYLEKNSFLFPEVEVKCGCGKKDSLNKRYVNTGIKL